MKRFIFSLLAAGGALAALADPIVVTTTAELEAALDVVAANQEIRIKEGHYATTKTLTVTQSCVTVRGVKADGSTPADRTQVILDGGGAHQVMCSTNNSISVYNLTISNGCSSASAEGTGLGAGAYLYGANAISNCVFACNDQTANSGGGLCVNHTTCKIEDCLFVGNHANQTGGGLYSHIGMPTLHRCVFRDNKSDGNGAAYATRNSGGASGIYDCTFEHNEAASGCGAVYCAYLPIVSNTLFALNVAKQGGPGALTTERNELLAVYDCLFLTNSSASCGGAIMLTPDATQADRHNDLSLYNCYFAGNASGSGYYGGAVALMENTQRSGLRKCINSVFVGNTAKWGGAIYSKGTSTVENCTFVNNTGTTKGGAIGVDYEAEGVVGITNCVFYGNASPTGKDVQRTGDDLSIVSHCYGSTASGFPTAAAYSNLLSDVSPFVNYQLVGHVRIGYGRDAALTLDWMTDGAMDIVGEERILNVLPDMGAYEYRPDRGLIIMTR